MWVEAPHTSPPKGLTPTALSCGDRYKMTCEYTWPNHLLGSDRAAVSALLEQHGLQGDVAFGHSKLFIRSPQTLVTLEQSRARLIPIIVLLLQKVRPGAHRGVGVGGAPAGCGMRMRTWGALPSVSGVPARSQETDLSKKCGCGSGHLGPAATYFRPRWTPGRKARVSGVELPAFLSSSFPSFVLRILKDFGPRGKCRMVNKIPALLPSAHHVTSRPGWRRVDACTSVPVILSRSFHCVSVSPHRLLFSTFQTHRQTESFGCWLLPARRRGHVLPTICLPASPALSPSACTDRCLHFP